MKIKLTESKLRQIISESVNKVLNEDYWYPALDLPYYHRDSYENDYYNDDDYDDDNPYTPYEDITPEKIEKGYFDDEVIENWETFYKNLSYYEDSKTELQAAAKKRKNFFDLITNNKLSKDWLNYINNSDFYDELWGSVNESKYYSNKEWNEEGKKVDKWLKLIFSGKFIIPKEVKELLTKILNAKNRDEFHDLVEPIALSKHYRELLWAVWVRQQILVDPQAALRDLESPSEHFNSEYYQGPEVNPLKSDEKDDEMWGDDKRRIRRIDKFIHSGSKKKPMTQTKFERGVRDNIIKHEFNGRNPDKQKLHTKGSANRDLMDIDRQRKK